MGYSEDLPELTLPKPATSHWSKAKQRNEVPPPEREDQTRVDSRHRLGSRPGGIFVYGGDQCLRR